MIQDRTPFLLTRVNASAWPLLSQSVVSSAYIRGEVRRRKATEVDNVPISALPLIEVENAGCVIPQQLALGVRGERLLEHRCHAPGEGAIGMRIVAIPGEVVVANQLDRSRRRRLVTAERDTDIAAEVVGRAPREVLVLWGQ